MNDTQPKMTRREFVLAAVRRGWFHHWQVRAAHLIRPGGVSLCGTVRMPWGAEWVDDEAALYALADGLYRRPCRSCQKLAELYAEGEVSR